MTDFIRAWHQGEGQGPAVNAFVPQAFVLGEAFQFDWSEEYMVVGGIYYRGQVSHMKLCASQASGWHYKHDDLNHCNRPVLPRKSLFLSHGNNKFFRSLFYPASDRSGEVFGP